VWVQQASVLFAVTLDECAIEGPSYVQEVGHVLAAFALVDQFWALEREAIQSPLEVKAQQVRVPCVDLPGALPFNTKDFGHVLQIPYAGCVFHPVPQAKARQMAVIVLTTQIMSRIRRQIRAVPRDTRQIRTCPFGKGTLAGFHL